MALRDETLCNVTLRDVTLSHSTRVLCLSLTCRQLLQLLTKHLFSHLLFSDLAIFPCVVIVTRFWLKADTAPYTFYFCGSQQVNVGIKGESIDIKPGKSLCCWWLIFNLNSDQKLQKCFKNEFNGISNLVWCGLKKYGFFCFHTATATLKFCRSMKVRKFLDIYVCFFLFHCKVIFIMVCILHFGKKV